ncbi:Crp/Fnr family transcriptional regulator [Segetibacter koreensis]|uniref:Crp/Fnr family transcriptional regulator n=1 Tax=Segetibacter koreensis TaxID=398037 RepID=UPI000371029E|nr:Crp/Fnr family transcriptional regulator [Segetibacter koreensis]
MLDNVKENLLTHVNFTDEEIVNLISKLESKLLKKNHFLLREGETGKHVAFLNKGLIRLYYVKEGKEHNSGFFRSGSWVSEYASFLHKKPSLFYIEALDETELFLLSYDNMQKLYHQGKAFERLGRLIAENLFHAYFKRNMSLILDSPEERYLTFLKENASLIELIPLKHIASYVGVEPESLSRIRKRINKLQPK